MLSITLLQTKRSLVNPHTASFGAELIYWRRQSLLGWDNKILLACGLLGVANNGVELHSIYKRYLCFIRAGKSSLDLLSHLVKLVETQTRCTAPEGEASEHQDQASSAKESATNHQHLKTVSN